MTDIIGTRKEKIGERIRKCRKAAKLTQDQLAAQITILMSSDNSEDGVNQSAISAWENGTQIPPLKRLIALSEIFRCDISYLLCDYDEKKKDVSDISEFTGLSKKSIEILQYLKDSKSGAVNISPFATQVDSDIQMLDRLITSEHFVKLLRELQYYRMDGISTPTKTQEKIPDNFFEVRAWIEQKGYKIEKKGKISEMHLQTAADILKNMCREILEEELEKRG